MKMSTKDKQPQFAICILEEQSQLKLADLCHACDIDAERIIELVNIGVLEPRGHDQASWVFGGASLHRARVVLRLQRDFDIDLAGAALALELMDEIASLRTRLRVIGGEY
jgi:chaperone modulatory protein CbpM